MKVIDVGGALHHWLVPKPFACLDMKQGDCEVNFIGDISMPQGWEEIVDFVENNGKFDFAICTHVLEDIRNPPLVLDILPTIAKSGFISVPTKRMELSVVECDEPVTLEKMRIRRAYLGYIHHRWIFSIKGGLFLLFPKLPIIEVSKDFEWVGQAPAHAELSFYWEGLIPYKIFQDDWLGPNPWDLANNYMDELKGGL